jgi:hypothetical protein
VLVWSEAWNAEGEKGKTDCCFEHTPIRTRVPTAPRNSQSSNSADDREYGNDKTERFRIHSRQTTAASRWVRDALTRAAFPPSSV